MSILATALTSELSSLHQIAVELGKDVVAAESWIKLLDLVALPTTEAPDGTSAAQQAYDLAQKDLRIAALEADIARLNQRIVDLTDPDIVA
jgi:hypothetical protein